MDLLLSNWSVILLGLLAFADIIVSLTPSKKDDQVLGYFRLVIMAITGANRRKNRKG